MQLLFCAQWCSGWGRTRRWEVADWMLTWSTATNFAQAGAANILCVQVNSATFPQWDGKWIAMIIGSNQQSDCIRPHYDQIVNLMLNHDYSVFYFKSRIQVAYNCHYLLEFGWFGYNGQCLMFWFLDWKKSNVRFEYRCSASTAASTVSVPPSLVHPVVRPVRPVSAVYCESGEAIVHCRPSPRPRGSARRKTASSLILRGHF